MSESLRDSAINYFNEALELMVKNQNKEALEVLEKAEEAAYQTKANDIFRYVQSLKGHLLQTLGEYEEALNLHSLAIKAAEELFVTDPDNEFYQSIIQMNLDEIITLGNLFYNTGRFLQAKNCYELHLLISQKLLENDPENVAYQSSVAMTLNNLGILLKNMGRIEEAKQRYEKALEIYTEPMQYLTIGRKSHSIMKLVELNTEQAKKGNQYDQMKCLKEAIELCKRNQDFFIKYELKHERELVIGSELSAYISFLLKNIRAEPDTGKRADEYEKAIKTVEKLKSVEEDEAISKLCDSISYYLSGRKLVNEALSSKQPDLERLKQAMEQFKKATETYEKANVCYCVYTGLFEVMKEIEKSEEVDIPKLKKVVEEVTQTLSDDVNPNICNSFKDLPQIFEEKDYKTRDKLLFDFLEKINSIEYRPLENLFEYIHKRTKDYIEEPFSPNLFYNNWKLRIRFDAEKIKGKLTIKTANTILFNRALSKEEIKDNEIEIDYLEIRYIPSGEDTIIFETQLRNQ